MNPRLSGVSGRTHPVGGKLSIRQKRKISLRGHKSGQKSKSSLFASSAIETGLIHSVNQTLPKGFSKDEEGSILVWGLVKVKFNVRPNNVTK